MVEVIRGDGKGERPPSGTTAVAGFMKKKGGSRFGSWPWTACSASAPDAEHPEHGEDGIGTVDGRVRRRGEIT